MIKNNIILFDDSSRDQLLPLTFTRPVCELRVGILTIREKWERWLNGTVSYITEEYLSDKYDIVVSEKNFVINGSVLPNRELVMLIKDLNSNEAILHDGALIAARLDRAQFTRLMNDDEVDELDGIDLTSLPALKINHLWEIFQFNETAIAADFELLTKDRNSTPLSSTNQILGAENIFVEAGAKVEFATINATTGPVYIGKNAEIMEGAMIRGPLALCEHATIKMGAKIYGATTIGPWSKVGGEVGNSVIIGYSNKGHDGYLGNAVIGEWCNLGADTNNSNLKNNYDTVKLWNYPAGRFLSSNTQFCGLIMGDHSKCGINTMFNTGTVVGVFANVFGAGFPRNFIPSFSWGGAAGLSTYRTDKAFATAEKVMSRRNKTITPEDYIILLRIFEDTAQWRPWDKKKVTE